MLRWLLNLCRRPTLRFGMRQDRRGRFRDPRFVSFIVQNNRRSLNTDLQDAVLQGRKLFRRVLILATAAGGAWVLIESAKALSMF